MQSVARYLSRVDSSGTDFEDKSLYHVPWEIDSNRTGFQDYNKALSTIRAHQPEGWDPSDPPTRVASDIHALVCDELGLEDYSELRLYTALGSSLDKHHGVDAVFELFDEEFGDSVTVTIDLTINPGKYIKGHKADVIVFGRNLEVAAREVADKVYIMEDAAVA